MTEKKFARRVAVAAITVLAGLAQAPATQAQDAKVDAGTLTCEGQGRAGIVVGSKEQLVCTNKRARGGLAHRFAGSTIRVASTSVSTARA